MGAVTGKGLAALIREKFSLRVTAFAMLALLIANFGTTVAEFSRRRRRVQPRARARLGVRAAGRGRRVAAGDARQLPQRGARLSGPHRRLRRLHRRRLPGAAPTGARPLHGTVVPSVQLDQPLAAHRDRRHRHHHHALGPVLHPGLHRRQARLDHASTSTPGSRCTWARCSPTPSTCSSWWPAPRRSASTASSSRPRRMPPGRSAAGRARGRPALRLRPAQRLDPRRGDPAADHRLRRSARRSASRAASTRSSTRRRSFNGLLTPSSSCRRGRDHPAPAARQGDAAEPGRERHPAADHPHLRAQDHQRPKVMGDHVNGPDLQHRRLGVLDRADRPLGRCWSPRPAARAQTLRPLLAAAAGRAGATLAARKPAPAAPAVRSTRPRARASAARCAPARRRWARRAMSASMCSAVSCAWPRSCRRAP